MSALARWLAAHSNCAPAGNANDGSVVSSHVGAWNVRSTLTWANAFSMAKTNNDISSWGGIYLNGCMCLCGYIYNGTEVGGSQHCVACQPGLMKRKLGHEKKCDICSAGKYATTNGCQCKKCPLDSSTVGQASVQVKPIVHAKGLLRYLLYLPFIGMPPSPQTLGLRSRALCTGNMHLIPILFVAD